MSGIKLRANGHNGPTGTTFFNLQGISPSEGKPKPGPLGHDSLLEKPMKERFKDILDLEDVQGVLFLNFNGNVVFSKSLSRLSEKFKAMNWLLFIQTLNRIQEAEFVFENSRCYLRKAKTGYILVIMGKIALIEMVRLHCDILLPTFEQQKKKPKGIGRFFKL